MSPHIHFRSLPPEGTEYRGSKPARAGLDGTKSCCVLQQRGLQDHASLEAARQEA